MSFSIWVSFLLAVNIQPMQHASRKKTRKFLLQKLYARIYWEFSESDFLESYFEWIMEYKADDAYLNEMFQIIVSKQDSILGIIKKYAPKFDLDTMLKTNILAMSIAIAEMLYLTEEIPAKVSINEAIDLSKYFWDNLSKNIVNGILNSFFNDIELYSNVEQLHKEKFNFFQS